MECDQEIGELQVADSPSAAAHNQPTVDLTQDTYYPHLSSHDSSESKKGRYGGYKSSYGPSAPADPPPPSYNDVVDSRER